ncbi:MAG: hypothetical protein WC475_02635 [Candidatus Paceibacterota bacterium]
MKTENKVPAYAKPACRTGRASAGKKEFYERLGRPAAEFSLSRRQQDVLFDKKWLQFLKLSRFFRYLPFIDFVLGSGSMALGNAHEDSDFDVIVGVKAGRIFTARFFCVLMFGLLGRRRQKLSHREAASDKICFNHFVALKSYRLRPPYNTYWRELYGNLVPIYGQKEKIREFFGANDWSGKRIYSDDLRHEIHESGFLGLFLEKILAGGFGDFLEKNLKQIQIKRIKKGLKDSLGFEPRLVFNDDELEFHPDTLRIHKLVK